MRRPTLTILTIALAVALGTPSALATWNALGSFEPDTRLDRDGGYMFLEPNTGLSEKMFLNVVPMQRDTEFNPNVGLVQSRILVPGNLGFDAFFGTWVDCNLDGYVGHVETIMIEYPSQLLPAGSPCNAPTLKMYNQQGWVSEMRWIRNPFATPQSYAGFDDNGDGIPEGRDQRSIEDLGASVWGDFGVPGDTGGREVCPRTPTNGAAQRSGAFLNWADCFTRHQLWVTANSVVSPLGMPYSEEGDFDQAGHPLNVGTLGEGGRNNTMATFVAYDCSESDEEPQRIETGQQGLATPAHQNATVQNQQYTVPWATVTDEEGELNVSVWSASYYSGEYRVQRQVSWDPSVPDPNVPSPSPSVRSGGTVAGTYSEVDGGCDPEGGNVYGWVESSTPAQDGTKRSVTLRFTYYEEQRNGASARGMPFYGAFVYPFVRSGVGPVNGNQWYSQSAAPSELGTSGPTPPQLVRTSDFQPEGAIHWTFYANLTQQSLSKGLVLPPAGTGTYGSEWCSRSTDPRLNGGFECDGVEWYLNAAGERIGGTEFHPTPGHPYQLRDVDCYDGTVMARDPVTGTDTSIVKASLAAASSDGGCA